MSEKEDYHKLQILIELDRRIDKKLKENNQDKDFLFDGRIFSDVLKELERELEERIINNNLKNEKKQTNNR